jgi:hypothetical protein
MINNSTFSLFQRQENQSLSILSPTITDNKKSLEELDKAADLFFDQVKPQKINVITNLKDLLETNFIVAENHNEISPKNFLIRNMPLLKKVGFTTLFVENLFYDDQKEFDNYCLNPNCNQLGEEASHRLKKMDNYMTCGNKNFKVQDRSLDHNYSAVVNAAKRAGIRIVGIESKSMAKFQSDTMVEEDFSYTSIKQLIKQVNFLASHIIRKEIRDFLPNNKWILLTGGGHTRAICDEILGLSELFGVPSIHLADLDLDNKEEAALKQKTQFNFTTDIGELDTSASFLNSSSIKTITYDVYIASNPLEDTPLISSTLNADEENNVVSTQENEYVSKPKI